MAISREEPTPTFGQQEAINKLEEADEDDLDEELDDAFVAQWRQQRLQALKQGDFSSGLQGQLKYGGMSTVDGEGYLDAIEKSPGVVVIVYISDDAVSGIQISLLC